MHFGAKYMNHNKSVVQLRGEMKATFEQSKWWARVATQNPIVIVTPRRLRIRRWNQKDYILPLIPKPSLRVSPR